MPIMPSTYRRQKALLLRPFLVVEVATARHEIDELIKSNPTWSHAASRAVDRLLLFAESF